MTSYPHLQMIKTRYKDVEEPAQGCVDKKSIYFRTEADASGQGFDNLLRTPFQLTARERSASGEHLYILEGFRAALLLVILRLVLSLLRTHRTLYTLFLTPFLPCS